MDDILDEEGDEETVGKKLKKDHRKQTYIKHYGLTASKLKIEQLLEEAEKSLTFLGDDSNILKGIAKYIGSRVS